MKASCLAGLASLASLGAQAQIPPSSAPPGSFDPMVVTASRGLLPANTLRDATVITREDIDASGALSLAEVLQRRAGVEVRSTGGPGQPQSLFIRGAGSAQTLVLVDGMRVGSATVGTTSIENIPLDLIERVEIVKGPMSGLYGSDAIGGIVQIFTRGKSVPHLFAAAGYGNNGEARGSAGLTAADDTTLISFSAGARRVDAPSATNARAFGYNPDRDPYQNAFTNLRVAQKLWQGETLQLEAFGSWGRTHFDAGPGDDRNDQTISGARFTSSTNFTDWWASRLALGQGRDRIVTHGNFPSIFETRQDQASWTNEIAVPGGALVAGAETVRQQVISDEAFSRTRRNTNAGFAGIRQAWEDQAIEASTRLDDDEQFGRRTTGTVSYGWTLPSIGRLAATFARGFRAPTFFDLYGPASDGYSPNPTLRPERSRSSEVSLQSDSKSRLQWRLTGFDSRLEDLIVYSFEQATVLNVARGRVRGIEAAVEGAWLGTRARAAFTAQRPRDEDTGKRLQGRSERFGSLELSRGFGSWTATVGAVANGARFDSTDESPSSRLPGYAVVDARVRYEINKQVAVELSASNLGDRRYEGAVGYDAPRRTVLLSLKLDAF
jgi:vitamin B12 transporter